jgi:hypothetical protein
MRQRPDDFPIDKWMAAVSDIYITKVPANWVTVKDLQALWGLKRSAARERGIELIKLGFLIRHQVGLRAYFERVFPVIPVAVEKK